MNERRFTETEVAEIFERATQAPEPEAPERASLPAAGALTLAQVQAIGREVGIAPERISAAAARLGDRAPTISRGVLGLPLRVERTIALDRRLSDEEWERVVTDLREVFDARGRLASDGSLRQWTNGNLQALLEPTATGQRIRLRTFKGNALGSLAFGLGLLTTAGVGLIGAASLATADVALLATLSTVGAGGLWMSLGTVLRLPRWAHRRREQMNEVAARVAQLPRQLSPQLPEPIDGG